MKTKLTLTKPLSHDDAATVLAALRFWQEHRNALGPVPEHFDHFEDARELSVEQIDSLCETINLQPNGKPTLIDFRYTGDGESFNELAILDTRQAHKVEGLLIDAVEQGTIEEDYYIGEPQTKPSTFESIFNTLTCALK